MNEIKRHSLTAIVLIRSVSALWNPVADGGVWYASPVRDTRELTPCTVIR